jgi:hypothetical protein
MILPFRFAIFCGCEKKSSVAAKKHDQVLAGNWFPYKRFLKGGIGFISLTGEIQ